EELTQGFRVPREVIAYASRLLPAIAPDLTPATSIRESAGDFEVRRVATEDLDAAVLTACERALTNEGSIGLIAAEARIPALRA
ncbi:AAA family ATPase, partial [bacterium LRH843]|nr:AAA family ATPase [bacterium LRH843]